jgi:NADPH-dependent 2,4-dienoyl-CoA reductase/sulfur reductase-like enzyme
LSEAIEFRFIVKFAASFLRLRARLAVGFENGGEVVIKPKIAIIGGGIGGLTAALACHRRGFDVEVYGRAPEIGAGGIGIVLWENIRAFNFDDVCAAMIIRVISVSLLDLLSAQIRKLFI